MSYKILITALYEVEKGKPLDYYYLKEENRVFFCDAFSTAEAVTKYVLARYPIDDIVAIGGKSTFNSQDDCKDVELRKGTRSYSVDIKEMSAYGLYSYRIAQYIDDLSIENSDSSELAEPAVRTRVESYIDEFREKYSSRGLSSHLFEELGTDRELYNQFLEGLKKILPEQAEQEDFGRWLRYDLYQKLKDSCKMDIIRENEDIRLRLIEAVKPERSVLPVDTIIQTLNAFTGRETEPIEVYVALDSSDTEGSYILMNLMDIANTMYSGRVAVRKVYAAREAPNSLANEIIDATPAYGMAEISAAMRAFLKYGKVDMLVDYWEKNGFRDERIDQMIYSMKRIDSGLSLCSISEMEKGINSLKSLFNDPASGAVDDSYYGKLFKILSDGIKMDYGKLLEGDTISFIEMVKWSFNKKFYQQTLTLIESRAPKEFVDKGIFYYADNDESRQNCIRILGQIRSEMRYFEYWQMDDVDHYFIKIYDRKNNPRNAAGDLQRNYAKMRVSYMDNKDPDVITAYSACDDRQLVENALYAYYHIGDIRNYTNHAEDRFGEETRLIVDEKDDSIRFLKIHEAIAFFIKSFEEVTENIGDRSFDMKRVSVDEIKEYARSLDKKD